MYMQFSKRKIKNIFGGGPLWGGDQKYFYFVFVGKF
jgi:hypothetical protein